MHRWLLSPRWLGVHAVLVLVLVVTGALGWWQLDRARAHHAASQHNAAVTASTLDPVPLHTVLAGATVSADGAGRTVTVTGHYDPARQLVVPDRPLRGRPGYLVVVPLVSSTGPAVMVDRGWVPATASGASPSVPPPPVGEQTVTGWLSAPDPMPAGAAAAVPGQVAAINAAMLVNVLPYRVVDGYVHRTSAEPASSGPAETMALTPVPRPEARSSGSWPLQNLLYAVEWWVFGGAAVWLWAVMLRHESGTRRLALEARVDRLAGGC